MTLWKLLNLLPIALLAVAIRTDARAAEPEASVVQITAELRMPNPLRPWARQNPVTVGGSGVVIDGCRILTNAHLLTYATDVWVQAGVDGVRHEANVEAVGHDVDLAVLTLEDPSFFDDHPPLPATEDLPAPMSEVLVYGFPIGGNGLSITRGIISRVSYGGGSTGIEGVVLQVDAAINPGNSGGPALVGGRRVGIAFSRLGQGENIGYIIPNEEIDLFLEDVADGHSRGKPRVDARFQTIENAALRERLGIDRSVRGVMVSSLVQAGDGCTLQPFDVLTRIGEHEVDDEGMVRVGPGLRLPLYHPIARLGRDGAVPVTVIRDGRELSMELPVRFDDDSLIPPYRGSSPPYFVCGPLVFSPARQAAVEVYFRARPGLMVINSLLETRVNDRARFEGEELVVVTAPMLPHRITRGYGESFGRVVESVNGTEIRNLAHLVETLRDAEGPYLEFRFADELPEVLVFRRQEFLDATAEVMTESGIPRRGSAELLAIWEREPGGHSSDKCSKLVVEGP